MRDVLRIAYDIMPGAGEDSYALRSDEQGAFLCVTDGCGGLGSRRYEMFENRTGAYIASRLASGAFASWAEECRPAPRSAQEVQILCRELENDLFHRLKGFADIHCCQEKTRITGSMQKTLPTTLCAFTAYEDQDCFWWAGDSRGYLLDEDGLHQYTRDHSRGEWDAFEMLYRDAPLQNLLSADSMGQVQCRRVQIRKPSVAVIATDGVYSALPSPMEVEMLLLDTLRAAGSFVGWGRRLDKLIRTNAQDDATLLMLPLGAGSFAEWKEAILPRRETLQKQFITPLRRHKGDLAYAREKWNAYRQGYDRTETEDE